MKEMNGTINEVGDCVRQVASGLEEGQSSFLRTLEPFRDNVEQQMKGFHKQSEGFHDTLSRTISKNSEDIAGVTTSFQEQFENLDAFVQATSKRLDQMVAERLVRESQLRDAAALEAQTAVAKRCSELEDMVEQMRSATLEETRGVLDEKCCEIRKLKEELCGMAIKEARAAVDEKCTDMRSFAANLQNALLEEVRSNLARGASHPQVVSVCTTPRGPPVGCGAGAGAVRALRVNGACSPAFNASTLRSSSPTPHTPTLRVPQL